MAGYAHLHVASGYSARYGASHPEQLVQRAAERGMDTLALTDRDTVTGTVRFAQACAAAGVRPVFGIDLAVEPLLPGAPAPRRRTPDRGGAHVIEPGLRFTLLARDGAGWARLCRITSAAHAGTARQARPAQVPWEDLRELGGEGLIVLLGPMSEPGHALAAGREDQAVQLIAPWREVFGDGVRLEVICHDAPGTKPGSLRLAAQTLALADRVRVPAVLTNAVRYADPSQHRLADVLDAARLLRPADLRSLDSGRRWLADPEQMTTVAERVVECAGMGPRRVGRLLEDTAAAADACRADPKEDLGIGSRHFPEAVVVGADPGPGGANRLLRERSVAGMADRGLDRDRAAMDRLEYELGVVAHLDYAPYFLAVGQVVADVRELGIRVAARGSGAGSMICHALRIATANPIEHHLLFERFLSVRRNSFPDIDLDVESERRLECYDAIFERFGRRRVGVTAMPETYRARHALRDTALALGIAPYEADRIAKSFPHIRACDIRSALVELPELRGLAAEAGTGKFGPLFELAEGLDALVRGMAMHPCGVIISDATLLDRLPVQPTPQGDYPMLQAAKEEVEIQGNLKLDVLGVRMQSAMAHAVDEIERTTGGERIDLDDPTQVPLDDFFAFKLIQESRTIGLFQLESPGQQDLLSRLQPRDPQDVIADISLFRPGPVAGGMPERYIAARHGADPSYAHPDLEPVLRDTYGVTIWHEQIIATFAVMTGCDRAAGEVARRALGDAERMPKIEAWFHEAAAARGYSQAVRDQVWETIAAFGAYGFCRAHAVAFAVPALQSAWLKAHHPAALLAGLLQADPGMWPPRVIVADFRRHGVPVLPVDVNASQVDYRVEGTGPEADRRLGVRLALSGVRGITEQEAARVQDGQPYRSLSDFWQRARPSRPLAERLAEIGALDCLREAHATRRDLLLQINELHRQSKTRTAGHGQVPIKTGPVSAGERSGLPDMSRRESVGAQLQILGVDVDHHLMEHHHRLLREIGATDAAHLQRMHRGQQVLVAGVKSATQTPPIASGRRVIFVTLEDGSGLVDLAFFDDSHEACAHTVFHSGLLLIRGTVEVRGRRRTVVGEMSWDLDAVAAIRRDRGPEAALELLGKDTPQPTPAQPGEGRTLTDPTTGTKMHPYSDLQPAGTRSADVRRLGHRSQGSAG
ncbi:DNA polymerase III subunit alpha [Actinacidiphila acidipaludis]|uniref:DNA-directed DNA polymerase n=1 Tax=Actinacidiphila acidipaludis TaxID=2873382 RepID=A0ABS7QIB4_9ACTN|nr:DNA polymerase III subunit alpha [Streptomyces acidipaludis]MBY8882897.1 DNA polymerase III subunit alpha [Streptomyces acidipaludis]